MVTARVAIAMIENDKKEPLAIPPELIEGVADPLYHACTCFELLAGICARGYQIATALSRLANNLRGYPCVHTANLVVG
jgi:hypothetical protein